MPRGRIKLDIIITQIAKEINNLLAVNFFSFFYVQMQKAQELLLVV